MVEEVSSVIGMLSITQSLPLLSEKFKIVL